LNRRGFLASSASIAAAPVAASASGVPGGTHRVERRADFDAAAFAAIVGRSAQIRQLYEAVAFEPAILGSIRNSFNGLEFGFGYPTGQIAIVLAGHGPSAVFGYSDYLWDRYRLGEFFKLRNSKNQTVTSNIYLARHTPADANADPDDDGGMYQDSSIEMLQHRGLIVLTCHTAVEEQASGLVRDGFAPAGMSAAAVADDILTHLIPSALVVPSMVATIAVLQSEYRYTYLSL
jgi:hypothetical protein